MKKLAAIVLATAALFVAVQVLAMFVWHVLPEQWVLLK